VPKNKKGVMKGDFDQGAQGDEGNELNVEFALQGGEIFRVNQCITIENYLGNHRLMSNHRCVVF
jgi:hypothetical protein